MAKFERPKMKVVNIGDPVPIGKIYEPDWMISNWEIVKINGEYVHLPPNHWNPYLSRVMRRNGKVYCNGRVWNAKRKKWQFSIKAYWYYIFDRRN